MDRDAKSPSDSPPSKPSQLPRGRHGLPREVVQRNHRERLLAATKKAVEDCGFAKVTVARICGHAAVSKPTFYEYFDSKEKCIEAAFGAPFESLVDKEAQQRFGSPPDPSHGSGSDDSVPPPSSTPIPLPPGRHGIPPEVVKRNQRERLLAGTARAVEEKGFAKVTIGDIVRHAAVSRRTFYDHFGGKEECLEAAFGGPADNSDGQSDAVVHHPTHGSSDSSELEQAQKELVNRHRRERVIAGALKAVEEKGLANVTIADIVRHARISRKIFYELFPGKDECIEAALDSSLTSPVDKQAPQRFGSHPDPSLEAGSDDSPAPPSSTPVPLPRERERLLAGAIKAVEERGLTKVRIGDIVRHAAVSREAFHKCFSSKQECLEAAFGGSIDSSDSRSDMVVQHSTQTGETSQLDREQKELIDRFKRERVIAGTIKAVEERGLAGVRVTDILRHAKLARKTFYEVFSGKDECIEAALDPSLTPPVDEEVRQRFDSPYDNGFGSDESLSSPLSTPVQPPRSRRGVPREVLQRHQRERLIAGAISAVEERGLAYVRVSDILRHAKVSNKTFYELFSGKDECLAAAERMSGKKLIDSSANRPESR
jgi:AcrR family transcriptional regulator